MSRLFSVPAVAFGFLAMPPLWVIGAVAAVTVVRLVVGLLHPADRPSVASAPAASRSPRHGRAAFPHRPLPPRPRPGPVAAPAGAARFARAINLAAMTLAIAAIVESEAGRRVGRRGAG